MDQVEFRKKLTEINNHPIFTQHRKLMDDLRTVHPHDIHIYSNPSIFDPTIDCFDFTFGDSIPSNIREEIKRVGQSNPDKLKKIISDLFSKNFIELHEQQQSEDRVVVYFKDETLEHFGKIVEGEIISKWGQGHIWKHGLWELPHSYGNHVKYSTGKIKIDLLRESFKV